MPKLVVVPVVKPLQGKGKTDPILHNGKPGSRNIGAQIFGNRGALQNKTIVGKALSRDQKNMVGVNAGIGTALSAGAVKRTASYGRSAGRLKKLGKVTEDGAEKAQLLGDARRLRGIAGRNALAVGAAAGISAGTSAGIMAGGNALANRRARRNGLVAKMSDAELKRRRNLQSKVAITTSTLGLGALGVKGASGVARKAGHLVRADKLSGAANTTALVSGGIGGAGGYNYASITRAEARKRPVAKAFAPRIKTLPRAKKLGRNGPNAKSERAAKFGQTTFGDNSTGQLVSQKPIEALLNGHSGVRRRPTGQGKFGTVIARQNEGLGSHFGDGKVRKAFDAEQKRHARNRNQEAALRGGGTAALAGAGAAGGLAGAKGFERRQVTTALKTPRPDGLLFPNAPGNRTTAARGEYKGRKVEGPARQLYREANFGERGSAAKKLKALKGTQRKAGKVGVGLAALGVGGMVAADRLASYGHGHGATYSARYRRPE